MTKQTPEAAVTVHDIHKEFVLPQSKNTSFKQAAVNIVKKNNKVTQKVLDGVSFTVNKGDFFGIVGRNGSGKSTLLKLIAGVYAPTEGSVTLHGGLTPFIELGVGFNPELSGRDNVYLNGALLGYDRKQMAEMYDEIVDFAELGPFMDQKLKNYSSGMQVRLAFSIAIKAKNDILIFDEVLAVGDEAFQRKCLDIFEQYKAQKQTVILVSHDMDTVRQYCSRAALISDGRLIDVGDPKRIARQYSNLNQAVFDNQDGNRIDSKESSIKAHLTDIQTAERVKSAYSRAKLRLNIAWNKSLDADIVMVDMFKRSGEHITGFKSKTDGLSLRSNHASLDIAMDIAPGKYYFTISVRRADDSVIEENHDVSEFMIRKDSDDYKWSGLALLDHHWGN